MALPTLATELQEILIIARNKAVELHQDNINTEEILDAVIKHDANNGVAVLKAANVNFGRIKKMLKDKYEEVKHTYHYNNPTPALSFHARICIEAAEKMKSPIGAAEIISAIYRDTDTFASQVLRDAGYFEAGERPKPLPSQTGSRNTPTLNAFSTDLTQEAIEGKLDPVIGRTTEIQRLVEILARKKKNNPILIGEPGVGKSAIAEGLALAIMNDNVPENLSGSRLLSLNLSAIVAGTMFRGQFEQRMQAIIKELKANRDSVVVFIDEIHTLMGSGGTEGTGDAAQILKPALSRGDIRCIGATTISEYRKHIEKDGALARRFQQIMVEPPTSAETRELLTKVKDVYEIFHGVRYSDPSLDAIVYLSNRYISDRNFPDKALDVMDEAGVAVMMQKNSTVQEMDIQKVVSKITGIPVTNLSQTERQKLKVIDQDLERVVIDQKDAILALSHAIKRSRTNIKSEERPSSFLFLGPTGVGKTELARQLALYLFGKEDSLLRFDMSEYSEKHTVSGLIGAPPGFVGYDEGGQLTEKVRRKPYSVVLLDEIEKAHPDIFNTFLQALDAGIITDAAGRKVDFRNTIMIFTSNIGSNTLGKRSLGFSENTASQDQKTLVTAALKNHFKPEFLNRLDDIIVFGSLSKESIKKILKIYIQKMQSRFMITFTEAAEEKIAALGYSPEYGARPLRRVLEKQVETQMSDLLLDDENAKSFLVDLVEDKIHVTVQQGAQHAN